MVEDRETAEVDLNVVFALFFYKYENKTWNLWHGFVPRSPPLNWCSVWRWTSASSIVGSTLSSFHVPAASTIIHIGMLCWSWYAVLVLNHTYYFSISILVPSHHTGAYVFLFVLIPSCHSSQIGGVQLMIPTILPPEPWFSPASPWASWLMFLCQFRWTAMSW